MTRGLFRVPGVCLLSCILFIACFSYPVFGQDKMEEVRHTLDEAKAGQAGILSPDSFSRAQEAYNNALKETEKGKSLDRIRKYVDEALEYANLAIRNTELAKVTFVDVLPAREKAIKAGAQKFVPDAWSETEAEFNKAAKSLERGDASAAKKKAREALDLYKTTELLAIKEDIIGETGRYIEHLEDEGVDKLAGVTLEKARHHLKQADEVLNRDRYMREDAEALDRVARYEAEHSLNLATRIERDEDEKRSQEAIYLEFEDDLMKIGKELGVSLQFDKSITGQADLLGEKLAELREERDRIGAELTDLRQKYVTTQEDRRVIDEQLKEERIRRERIERVAAYFEDDEAQVLQEGKKVLIRLTSFTFPSGTSVIEPQFFPLLTKVQRSIEQFPLSDIVIEGHTDAKGDDSFNEKLSQTRADAIRTYLVANLGLNPARIIAVGYGERKPIATNDTNQGRALNRRVDVVINPKD